MNTISLYQNQEINSNIHMSDENIINELNFIPIFNQHHKTLPNVSK